MDKRINKPCRHGLGCKNPKCIYKHIANNPYRNNNNRNNHTNTNNQRPTLPIPPNADFDSDYDSDCEIVYNTPGEISSPTSSNESYNNFVGEILNPTPITPSTPRTQPPPINPPTTIKHVQFRTPLTEIIPPPIYNDPPPITAHESASDPSLFGPDAIVNPNLSPIIQIGSNTIPPLHAPPLLPTDHTHSADYTRFSDQPIYNTHTTTSTSPINTSNVPPTINNPPTNTFLPNEYCK
eukprot:4817_1